MTAVEWLEDKIQEQLDVFLPGAVLDNKMIEQAKQIEKQQIIDAHIEGFYSPPFGKSRNGEAEKYYNETFKSE
jgi:hypothetical protein